MRWQAQMGETKAVFYIKEQGRIANSEYQKLCQVAMRTASRDLAELVQKGIILQEGRTGKGTFYTLKLPQTGRRRHKDATNTPN